jgi:iron complex outermembrane recepter protein
MNRFSLNRSFICALTGVAVTAPTFAQDGSQILAEIVVTAQKRETTLQDTPLAISAVSGADVEKKQIKTLEDLASSVPSMTLSRTPNVTLIAIRGVGAIDSSVGTESRVAIHNDGIYVGRPEQALNQFFDVSRIEYLRGPQGTLYGRNATAGAINIITSDPSANPDGYLRLTGGNYTTTNLEGASNVPLGGSWNGRVAFIYNNRDGYGRDINSGREIDDLNARAVRAKVKYESEDFELVVGGDYGRQHDHSGAFHFGGQGSPGIATTAEALGGLTTTNFSDIATDSFGFPEVQNEYYDFSTNAQWQHGDNEFTAVLGYGHSDKLNTLDVDGSNLALTRVRTHVPAEQYSGEFRFHRGKEQYDLLAGVYYFHEMQNATIFLPLSLQLLGGPPLAVQGVLTGGMQKDDAYAAFAQLRWNFSSVFYAEVGARYSYEHKETHDGTDLDFATLYSPAIPLELDAPLRRSHNWKSFDPKLTVGYTPSSNVLAYATAARGFKSGGFNLGTTQDPYEPERITDYEAGLKLTSEDRRLMANFSIYYYKYSNMQVNKVVNLTAVLENAAKATVKGIEAEINWAATDSLAFRLDAEYNDGKYDEFDTQEIARPQLGTQDLSGNRLPQSPDYRVKLDASYTWLVYEGDLTLRADAAQIGRIYFSQYNRPEISTGKSNEFNAFLTFDAGDWTVGLYGRNLSNERKLTFAQVDSALFGFPIQTGVNVPRTYGASITRRW